MSQLDSVLTHPPVRSKSISLFWIVLAYILCALPAWFYLELGLFSPWRSDNLLLDVFIADSIATVVIFIFSRLFANSSFYDPYWSVIPPAIFHYWLYKGAVDINRAEVIAIGIVIWYWAIRLTWNWTKHWPGLHHEDWRYPILKNKIPSLNLIVDFMAIHFFPTVQVFLGMVPVYFCLFNQDGTTWLFALAFIAGIAAPTIQLIADRQLHSFIATRKSGEIIQHGLWAYSRHPNYFGEWLFWISLALFGLAVSPALWYWQILGVIGMLAMFMGASIPLMEERSLERRPEYQKVIDKIPMFIPWFPKQ